jgi:hypothetical protein
MNLPVDFKMERVGAWVTYLPTNGEVARAFMEKCQLDLLENITSRWAFDQSKVLDQIRKLCEYDAVLGTFPPQALEGLRVARLAFDNQEPGWDRWPDFYAPVLRRRDAKFLRLAQVA